MSHHGLPAGTYKIHNVSTGTALDLRDGNPQEGTPVQGFRPNGGKNQQWRLKYTGKHNQATLQNVQSGTYIGAESNIRDGVQVVGSKGAVPLIIHVADKGYILEVANHRLYVLDLKEDNSANETPVIYYENHESNNQKWEFIKVG